jgi:Fe-S-cluster containining protein
MDGMSNKRSDAVASEGATSASGGGNLAGCATCKGRCCREYRVHVTAADIRTLAAGTTLHPSDFVRLHELDNDKGFHLRPHGPAMELLLVRNRWTGACVFLLEIAPDRARCGVYAHRPSVCRAYPMTFRGGAVDVRQDAKCGPDTWNLSAMDLPKYRCDLNRSLADWTDHWKTVAEWNTAIDAAGQERSPNDLFDFLLNHAPSAD